MGEVDGRRTIFSISDRETGEMRRMAFADIELQVGDIPIPEAAPEEIRDLLVTAKNLLLYSWYYYPFSVTAALQAVIAVEGALKLRLNRPDDTLHTLLRDAIKQSIITEAGFPRWRSYVGAFQELHSLPRTHDKAELTKVLLKTFPPLRNTIAHGNRYLDDSGFQLLDIASEVIGQLFPDAKRG